MLKNQGRGRGSGGKGGRPSMHFGKRGKRTRENGKKLQKGTCS